MIDEKKENIYKYAKKSAVSRRPRANERDKNERKTYRKKNGQDVDRTSCHHHPASGLKPYASVPDANRETETCMWVSREKKNPVPSRRARASVMEIGEAILAVAS